MWNQPRSKEPSQNPRSELRRRADVYVFTHIRYRKERFYQSTLTKISVVLVVVVVVVKAIVVVIVVEVVVVLAVVGS